MQIIPLELNSSAISSVGCGSTIRKAYFPQSIEDLMHVSHQLSVDEYIILGKMTNTLLLDGYEGAAVLSGLMKGVSVRGNKLRIGAGENFNRVCGIAQYESLGGLEGFFGLPGTIGGAVSGNSGCFGTSVGDVIDSVTVFKLDEGQVEVLSGEEIAFGYRYCNLRKNRDFIIDVTLSLYRERQEKIAEKMAEVRRRRKLTQPAGKTLGSFFKQHNGISAGYYIEQAGLKGYQHKGVRVSNVHANFLINEGGTAEDYLETAEIVARTVYERLGIKLEREVIVIGEEFGQRTRDR